MKGPPRLKPLRMTGVNYNIADGAKFDAATDLLAESLFDKGATLFCSDNVITWNRNLSFLRDSYFMDRLNNPALTVDEKSIVWRTYILRFFAGLASHAQGDFLEFGCHTGNSAMAVVEKINFAKLGKSYYLYDLFDWREGDAHAKLDGHDNPKMFEEVVARFAPYPFVKVIKGAVPDSMESAFPEKIAFAHIDMNSPVPEAAALKRVLPRLSSGGVIVFDDYGWWGYSAQKLALDPIIAEHDILELPTGQALMIKP